jgi:hypothetical protein
VLLSPAVVGRTAVEAAVLRQVGRRQVVVVKTLGVGVLWQVAVVRTLLVVVATVVVDEVVVVNPQGVAVKQAGGWLQVAVAMPWEGG